jgi:hypothetical protein
LRKTDQYIFRLFLAITLILSLELNGQPFSDIIAFNSQHFFSNYKDSSNNPLYTQNLFLNLLIPKKFGNEHVFLVRLNAEKLSVNRYGSPGYSEQVFSLSLPFGCVLSSYSKKWKYTGIFVPKINSDFKDNLSHDIQYGAIGIVTRVVHENLQIKGGLYYNRECFGNFFMPLLGVDWKINDKLRLYGILPSNYRMECKISPKWNTGIGFRSFQRSFRLNKTRGNDFLWVRENQLKLYLEGFIAKNLLITVDGYRSINYKFSRNDYVHIRQVKNGTPAFDPFKDNFGFTIGFAYRIENSKKKRELK